MRVSDVNAFKGQFKDASLKWAGSLVDQMLPNKVAARTLVKNAIGNVLARLDGKVNQMVDTAFVMFGDADGVVDTDSTIDLICDMLKEMPQKEYSLGMLSAKVGKGEVFIAFPHGIFSDLLVGDVGGVRFTTEDFKQLKNYLS
jgi:hypothetical protein